MACIWNRIQGMRDAGMQPPDISDVSQGRCGKMSTSLRAVQMEISVVEGGGPPSTFISSQSCRLASHFLAFVPADDGFT